MLGLVMVNLTEILALLGSGPTGLQAESISRLSWFSGLWLTLQIVGLTHLHKCISQFLIVSLFLCNINPMVLFLWGNLRLTQTLS